MAKEKRSFFERLTGSVEMDDYDEFDDQPPVRSSAPERQQPVMPSRSATPSIMQQAEDDVEGQLTVDVYQTADEIIIKAIVAGVRPEDLDVSITRDMVTIRGKREDLHEVSDENYFYRELYWGSFSRTILLPQEVEVEEAEAIEKHGLLTLRLPKIDKAKQTKLKVKAN
jgi:HSP20 family protein